MSLQETQDSLTVPDLRLVEALATAGSLVRAARQLGLDHSSAFRRLNTLDVSFQ